LLKVFLSKQQEKGEEEEGKASSGLLFHETRKLRLHAKLIFPLSYQLAYIIIDTK